MPALPNPKHEAFAQAYVRGETAGNRQRSYAAAGYTCRPKSRTEGSFRLIRHARVMQRIAELQQEMRDEEMRASERALERLAITKEAVLREFARIAFANMLDYVRPGNDGRIEFDLARIDRDTGAAIREIVFTPTRAAGEGETPPRKPINRIRRKLADKRAALVDLGRHFGLFVERRHADDYADLGEDALAAKIRDVVGQLERLGIDVRTLFGIGEADLGGGPPARPN